MRCGQQAVAAAIVLATLVTVPMRASGQERRAFATPAEAVKALTAAAKASQLDDMLELFGPEGKDLADSTDATTARQNRDVFVAAMTEGWRLVDKGTDRKELIVGNESWPFPVPLVKTAKGWVFDAAAGKKEVLTRRIGRNELAAIRISQTYVVAQQVYARRAHDGKPAGIYARRLGSRPGMEDGLYWPAKRGEPLSPLGELVAEAAAEGRPMGTEATGPIPFHGYYFRLLEQQGPAAPGGAKSYVVNGEMSGGFGLVAWPAQYNATGIMTFMVGADGIVYEKDLGPSTSEGVAPITTVDPGTGWERSEVPDLP